MSIEDLARERSRLEKKTHEEIQKALDMMRGDISKTNEYAAKQANVGEQQESGEEPKEQEPIPSTPTITPPQQPLSNKSPLIYLSYPMTDEMPLWADTLRKILSRAGYLIFSPHEKIQSQIGQKDIPILDLQPQKVVKTLCPLLQIPEEVLLPFDTVWQIFQKGDQNDSFSFVFKSLWFLSRSSLVISDQTMASDAQMAQELLYAKQLNIPVIGLFPTSGGLNPFLHRATTAFFTGTDLMSLLPMIQGYSPL